MVIGKPTSHESGLGIALLGQPRFTTFGEPFVFRGRPRSVQLLAFLLLHRTAHLTRDAVAFALWPDDSESDARANLRRHLHHLTTTLPASALPYITTADDTISWNLAVDVWFDVDEFERLATDSARLAEAVTHYGGDLLPGVYDDWVFPIRDRLRRRYLAGLETLMNRSRSRRDFAAAITYADAILRHDEWREDTVRQLAAIRFESGDRAGALRELESFSARLQAEMGIEPMPETAALRGSILRGDTSAFVAPEAASDTAAAGVTLPFVGRARELEQLQHAWQRAARGRGEVVFLAGEAGIGKSRLASETALLVAAQGGRVLRGATSSPETMPYAAIVDALRDALPFLRTLEIRPIWLAVLTVLVPELSLGRDDLPHVAPLDAQRERVRLFEAMAAVVAALARQRPMLLVIEDLHWAGEATLAALEYLARRSAGISALIVATYRSGATDAPQQLMALRRRLQLENVSSHLQIGGLGADAVVALANELLPPSDDPAEVGQAVHALSGGNPLFAAELLRERAETEPGEVVSSGLPAVLEARLARLSAKALTVARIASVIGSTFEIDVIADVCGWDETAVFEALGILLERQIARETGRTRFAFAFTHTLIESTIYRSIDAATARHWHARVAESIERAAIEPDAAAGALAAHFDAAGLGARAVPYYLRSARRAFAIFANDEALGAVTRGLALAAQPEERFEILALRERIAGRLGDRERQRADLAELDELAVARADPLARCDVLARRADLARACGDVAGESVLLADFAAAAAAIGDPSREAAARCAVARNHAAASRYDDAHGCAEEALARYRALADLEGQVEALCLLSEIAVNRGFADRVGGYLDNAQRAAEAVGNPNTLARVAMARAAAAIMQRAFGEARTAAESAVAIYRAVGDREGEADSLARVATALAMLLRFDESRAQFTRAAEIYRSTGNRLKFAHLLFNQCSVEIQSGLIDAAHSSIVTALDILETAGDVRVIAACRANLCMIQMLAGSIAAARSTGMRAVAEARAIANPLIEAAALANLGNAERELGNTRDALSHMRAAIAIRHRLGLRATFEELADLALAELASGDLDASRKTADDILRRAPGSDENTVWPHYCYWAAARVYRACGDPRAAHDALARAGRHVREQLDALGDSPSRNAFRELETVRAILAALEENRWPPLPPG